jgi:hypothetical protein
MRRPGGAVWPAMKPTTGFFTFTLIHSAAFFGVAADFADQNDGVRRIVVEKANRVEE